MKQNRENGTPMRFQLKRNKASYRKTMEITSTNPETLKRYPEQYNHEDNYHTIRPTHNLDENKPHDNYTFNSTISLAARNKREQIPYTGEINDRDQAYQQIKTIMQAKCRNTEKRFSQYQTHSYTTVPSQHGKFHLGRQNQNIPKIVTQIYEQEMLKKQTEPVHYQHGYLHELGYFYYAIECKLIFISSLTYSQFDTPHQFTPLVFEMDKPVLVVQQIFVNFMQFRHQQIHPFGQHDILLVISQNWQIQFWAFKNSKADNQTHKFINLNLKIAMPVEVCRFFEMSSKGELIYLDNDCRIGRVSFQAESSFWNRKRSLSINNYIYANKGYVQRRKHTQKSIQNDFWHSIKQNYKDLVYFIKKKRNKPIQLKLDPHNKLIYVMLEAFVEGSNSRHREIRIYQLSQQLNSYREQLLAYVYNYPPKLLYKITQQQLYSEIGSHLFSYLTPMQFRIKGFHLMPYNDKNGGSMLVVVSNGCRLFLKFRDHRVILTEMINLPEIDKLNVGQDSFIKSVSQQQPVSLKIVDYLLTGGIWLVTLSYHRKIYVLCITKTADDKEQVIVLQQLEGQTLMNRADYKIYPLNNVQFSLSAKRKLIRNSPFCLPPLPLFSGTFNCQPSFILTFKKHKHSLVCMRPIDVICEHIYRTKLGALPQYQFELQTIRNKYEQRNGHIEKHLLYSMLVEISCDIFGNYMFKVTKESSSSLVNKPDSHINPFMMMGFAELRNTHVFGFIQNVLLSEPSEIVEQAIIEYICRLLLPLWRTSTSRLEIEVLDYLKKIFERLLQITRSLLIFKSLTCFLSYAIELFALLQKLMFTPGQNFGRVLSYQPDQLEQYIFASFVRRESNSEKLHSLIESYPLLINTRVIKAIKIVSEAQGISSTSLYTHLANRIQDLPIYLLQHLHRQKYLKEQDLQKLLSQSIAVGQKDIQKIRVPNGTYYQKYQHCYSQAKKPIHTLEQKNFLILMAQQNLWLVNNVPDSELIRRKQQLEEFKKILKVQRVLKKAVGLMHQNGLFINRQTRELINSATLTLLQLERLVETLNLPDLSLIYYAHFGGSPTHIKDALAEFQLMSTIKKIETSKGIHKVIAQLFNNFSYQSVTKIPVELLMTRFDDMVSERVKRSTYQTILNDTASKKESEELWVGPFLVDRGWNPYHIYKYMIEKMQEYSPETNTFKYYWCCLYLFVRYTYLTGRMEFKSTTQHLLRSNHNRQVHLVYSKLLDRHL